MKKTILIMLLVFGLTSCERNDGDLINSEPEMNFNQTPNSAFDNEDSARGLYIGTIKTVDVTEGILFHEIITLNLANDGTYFGYINRQNGEEMVFLTENTIDDNVLVFKTETSESTRVAVNEFTITIEDNYPVFSNVIINNRESSADVTRGDSSRGLPIVTKGTISGDNNGTFDISFYEINPDKFEADGLSINVGQNSFNFGSYCQIDCSILPDGGIAYNRYCEQQPHYVFSAYESQGSNFYMINGKALSFLINLSSESASCNAYGSFPLSGQDHSWLWNDGNNSGSISIDNNTLPLFPVGR